VVGRCTVGVGLTGTAAVERCTVGVGLTGTAAVGRCTARVELAGLAMAPSGGLTVDVSLPVGVTAPTARVW
jgi:hypothetical protein